MSRSSMSEDIYLFTGLEIHVRSVHLVRFFGTLQSTYLEAQNFTKVVDNCLTNIRALS